MADSAPGDGPNTRAQSFIFIGLATLNIVISLDGGGVPAALSET